MHEPRGDFALCDGALKRKGVFSLFLNTPIYILKIFSDPDEMHVEHLVVMAVKMKLVIYPPHQKRERNYDIISYIYNYSFV